MRYALCLGLTIVCFMSQAEASLTQFELTDSFKAAGYVLCEVQGDDLVPVTSPIY